VASEYFTILSFRERIAIAQSNIAAAKRILAITQAKVNSGVSSNLDLAEQQAVVAQQESVMPGLIQNEKQARYSLAILLGRSPEGFDVKAQNLDGVDAPSLQPGLPSELLLRNPSIAQAEAQLYAAHASVDAARSLYFPSLSLNAGAGYGPVSNISGLFGPGGFVWNIGAGVLQTIFDGGKIHAQNDAAKALQTELIANYRKTVFTAFSDVERRHHRHLVAADQSAAAFRRPAIAGADQAGAAAIPSGAVQCAGRRLGPEDGRCQLQEPARLVASVITVITAKRKGASRRPFFVSKRGIFVAGQERGAVHSDSVWTAKTPVSDERPLATA
jgi:outer membrane protein TolC